MAMKEIKEMKEGIMSAYFHSFIINIICRQIFRHAFVMMTAKFIARSSLPIRYQASVGTILPWHACFNRRNLVNPSAEIRHFLQGVILILLSLPIADISSKLGALYDAIYFVALALHEAEHDLTPFTAITLARGAHEVMVEMACLVDMPAVTIKRNMTYAFVIW